MVNVSKQIIISTNMSQTSSIPYNFCIQYPPPKKKHTLVRWNPLSIANEEHLELTTI